MKPGKAIADALAKIGVGMETISGVLITHEHSDHIAGAGVLARRYHLPMYATAGTWQGIGSKIGEIPPGLTRVIGMDREFYLGDIGVSPFSIPHDAADPVGFRLWGGSLSISTATDLGHFSDDVYRRIAGSDLVLLESNHDPDMLRANPKYAPALKKRILGDYGHLSGENNTPGLARRVSEKTLAQEGIRPGTDVQLQIALRDETGEVYCIQENSKA